VYQTKSSGLYEFRVSATRPRFDMTATDSLSVNVLHPVFGLRLNTCQPHAMLLTNSTGSLYTDPVLFSVRC